MSLVRRLSVASYLFYALCVLSVYCPCERQQAQDKAVVFLNIFTSPDESHSMQLYRVPAGSKFGRSHPDGKSVSRAKANTLVDKDEDDCHT